MMQTAHRFMEYAASWVQLPLPFPARLMRLRLARPTTMAARAARAARSAARKAAQAIKRMAPRARAPLAKKPAGSIANKQQAALFSWKWLGTWEQRHRAMPRMVYGFEYAA